MQKPLSNTLGSWHPLRIILLCIRLVVMGALPLKTAASSLKISFETLSELKNYNAPSSTTIKRWVQKVGYYKLISPKAIADDWMVLIDASIQMGEKKCLLVVGCRKKNLPMNRALKLDDLEILALRIVSSLNAKVVTETLNTVALSIGKILCITIDQGSDILRGVKDFQLSHPETRYINDTAHRVANNLKIILEKSERWKAFREQVTQARRQMQHSLIPGILPPSPLEKARYMNVGSLIEWALNMLI